MNKELQDLAWSLLPKEFKEEVRKIYNADDPLMSSEAYELLDDIFGRHNLTSDAEGEDEMLCVSRKKVQEFYAKCKKVTIDPYSYPDYAHESALSRMALLDILFGSKCLPDEGTDCTPVEVGVAENATTSNVDSPEPNVDSSHGNVESLEPKPAEPKFKYNIGQKVKSVFANEILTIKEHCGRVGHDNVYKVEEYAYTWNECELRPCTEPKNKRHVSVKEACEILGVDESEATKLVRSEPIETCTETCTDDCSSPDHFVVKHEMVDNIKDGFKNHNRLNIAAKAMQGILSNIDLFKNVLETGMETLVGDGMSFRAVAKSSFIFADALINEAEEGGSK